MRTPVEHAGARQPCGRAADRRDRDAGDEETLRGLGERCAPP
jgi:hypothetical protein